MMLAPDALAGMSPALSDVPRDADGPVFREPWEAQAFAMVVALQARGVFTWTEWAALLSEEIALAQRGGDPDSGASYYRHWLRALERMIGEKNVADPQTQRRYRHAWAHAAARVAHGQPVELTAEDFHD